MTNLRKASSLATLCSVLLSGSALAQDIFTTEDYRNDSARWTDPAYYRNNTAEDLRGMAINAVANEYSTGQSAGARGYGSEGSGREGALELGSPYAYTSADEHYQAWLNSAEGGTSHTYETMPDWRGRWVGGAEGLRGGDNPASTIASMLTPDYRGYYVQSVKAAAEGRDWWAGAFCLPGGFLASVTDAEEFVVTPEKVWILGAGNGGNYIRWIYTDGSGHSEEQYHYPKWHGESVGFWDGDELYIHTNQIRGWKDGILEFSDGLEAVERYRRDGDVIEGEITLYDPDVFLRPFHSKLSFERDEETRPELRPLFNTCTDTNGPSSKVHLDENGYLNERLPGDPLYWDVTDPRPWGTWFDESDRRFRAFLEAGGTHRGQ